MIVIFGMAHTFLKQMTSSNPGASQYHFVTFFVGGFFLLNSYIAGFLFPDKEASEIPAIVSSLIFGLPLVYNAMKDMLTGQVEMNELAALSFTVSFCTANYKAASVIAFFMIISHLIENRSESNARKNIEALLKLAPSKAQVIIDGSIVERDADSINEGDIVQVLPGDRIPGDGIVIEGISTVDESAITGESLPVEKVQHTPVFSGTVNLSGRLVVRITSGSGETVLSKIKDLIRQAERSPTPVMKIINHYASWYTPSILMLSGIILFFTRDIQRAISMLILSCPCTVILSAPVALVTALGAAARSGVIFRDVSILEIVQNVTTIIFDKTGTLTYGNLIVSEIKEYNDTSLRTLLYNAGSLEQYSHHPAAKAIIKECTRCNIPLSRSTDFYETAGMGVSGIVDGKRISVGRIEWIQKQCTQGTVSEVAQDIRGTSLYILVNGQHCGTLILSDVVKHDARTTIETLRKLLVANILMLTGDKTVVAETIAQELGCSFEAEMLPDQKMTRIRDAKSSGEVVAMIGDGVNDAPALAAGDVSIAMGRIGSEVAIHSASIVLMNDNLDRIPFIFRLSRLTVSIIRQNIMFSILFILVMITMSASGFVSPVSAAILHSLSTIIVVLNSARMLRMDERTV